MDPTITRPANMEWRHPSMIVVTGYPFAGKTSLAMELVKYLQRCMMVSLDDILDAISPPAYSSLSLPPPEAAAQLVAQAFGVLCRVAAKQLRLGLSVVVDCKLSDREQLDQLLSLNDDAKVVVVECWIDDYFDWERRYEISVTEGLIKKTAGSWHKHKPALNQVRETMESSDDRRLDEPVAGLSKLLLDMGRPFRVNHVIQAIRDLVFSEWGEYRFLDYRKWKMFHLGMKKECKYPDTDLQHCNHCLPLEGKMCKGEKELISSIHHGEKVRFCSNGHSMTVFKEEGLDYEASCGVCDKVITGAAYACNSCTLLALHKSCAEMEVKNRFFTQENFPTFLRNSNYCFPEKQACLLCKDDGGEFSHGCSSCVFQSHLRSGLVPTIIGHAAHAHKLHFWAASVGENREYKCAACGKAGRDVAYGCEGCDRNYHVECALLPYTEQLWLTIWTAMDLMFTRNEEERKKMEEGEEHPCRICGGRVTPEEWYYYSNLEYETAHVYHCACVFHTTAKRYKEETLVMRYPFPGCPPRRR